MGRRARRSGRRRSGFSRDVDELERVVGERLVLEAAVERFDLEADVNGPLLGAPVSAETPDAGFAFAPQASLYPDSTARPSPAVVAAFLHAHGIEYKFLGDASKLAA